MKNTISAFLMMIMISITTILSSSMITAHESAIAARNFNTNAIERIQASYFNKDVIKEIQKIGEKKGYTVTVEDTTMYADKPQALVRTEYKVGLAIPMIGKPVVVGHMASVEGYAR